MTQAKIALLPDRGVVSVTGEDAAAFLDSLITNDADLWPWLSKPIGGDDVGHARGRFAGLLSPQGKILFDFILAAPTDANQRTAFLIDITKPLVADFIKRLTLYKLRAKVTITDETASFAVHAHWDDGTAYDGWNEFPDPRSAAMGHRFLWRTVVSDDELAANLKLYGSNLQDHSVLAAFSKRPKDQIPVLVDCADYHAHRIGLGVPEGGKDYAFGEAFPHEALFDRLNGVSFTKGCYVGQEIVARMEHRGTARKRIVRVTGPAPLPPAGTDIAAGEVVLGTMGSSAEGHGLAMLRLDRVAEFAAKGVALTAAGMVLTPDAGDLARSMPQSPDPQPL